jgi:hypothetical protein
MTGAKPSFIQSELFAQLVVGAVLALGVVLMLTVRLDSVTVFGVPYHSLIPWALVAASIVNGVRFLFALEAAKRPVAASDVALTVCLAVLALNGVQSFALQAVGFIALGLNGAVAILLFARWTDPRNKP